MIQNKNICTENEILKKERIKTHVQSKNFIQNHVTILSKIVYILKKNCPKIK